MHRLLELLPLDWFAFLLLLLGVIGGVLFVAALDLPAAFLLLPAAGLGAGVVYLWPSRRRAAAFRRAAVRLGYTYLGKANPFAGDADFDRRRYELLWRPDTTYGFAFRNLMRGTGSPGETALFDFRYNSIDGYSFEQTVAAFSSPAARWPQFSLVPKGILDRAMVAAASAVGFKRDLDFNSHPAFTRRYLVRGADETAVRALFNPGALELWTSLPQRGWSACGAGRWLLVFRDHRLIPPRRLGDFLEQARLLAQSFSAI